MQSIPSESCGVPHKGRRSSKVVWICPDRNAWPDAIGPNFRPGLRRSEKLIGPETAACGVAERFEHQEIARRTAGECFVVADFQQPKSAARFHRELCRCRMSADPHE